jgi:hypothetical protein
MDNNQEQVWQAYIDGELSATEMAGFEASLSPEEQERLTSDIQFDRGLSERLSEDAACPYDVWERTKALLIQHSADEESTPKRRSMVWGAGTLAAAAALAFVISTFTPFGTPSGASPIILEAATIDDLVRQSQVPADLAAIQAFMHANDIDLDLLPEASIAMAEIHAPLYLVGASKSDNGDCVELYAGCCKEPVKILIVRRDSEAARLIGQATGSDSDVQCTRIVGDYLTAVVGKHSAHDLLDIFAGQHP